MRHDTLVLLLTALLGCSSTDPALPPLTATPLAATARPWAGGLPAETHPAATDRPRQALDGDWHFRFDDADEGVDATWFAREHFDDWDVLPVPAAWDLAHPEGFDRQTVAWYARTLTPPAELGPRVILEFAGIFREARVWLDGVELGGFDLPYLPFAFDVTDALADTDAGGVLVVRIDNRLTMSTLPGDTDFHRGKHGWFPYGGLIRPVVLTGRPDRFASQVQVRARPDGALSAEIWLHGGEVAATLRAWVTDPEGVTVLASPAVTVDPAQPGVRLAATLPGPRIWSPEANADRYRLHVEVVAGAHRETSEHVFGVRAVEARDGRFWLNDQDRVLRGINRHEDHPELGPVYDDDLMATDLGLFAELGVDFVRPGHYPNDVRGLDAFEAAGLLIAEEVPVYQLAEAQMADPVLVDRAVRALQSLIVRDGNRPGIVLWSLSNENHSWADTAADFNRTMRDAARALDPDRPVMVVAVTLDPFSLWDDSSGVADVIGINEYYGWYYGECRHAGEYLDAVHALFPERTFLITEYGAGCELGRHLEGAPADEPVGAHSYSEEYQAWFHRQHLEQLLAREYIRGILPWAFADFRMQWSPTTGDPHPVPQMNLKGLVSFTRERKPAFDVVAEAYRR